MKDYDAILGLDWLEEHYALMDCRRKIIIFRIPDTHHLSTDDFRLSTDTLRNLFPESPVFRFLQTCQHLSIAASRLSTDGVLGRSNGQDMIYIWTMATHGRRGAGPTQGDESAGGSQAPSQQAQDQTGVPLPPPPPPVEYGVLMQGLVHAMQTQAQTTAALQAQVQIHKHADVWWSSVLRTQFGDGAMEVAWAEFVCLFRAKYIPEHTQGSMNVLEYEARFAELSKYAPHIVADERRKVKKFIMGLKPSLRTRLVALGHRSMEEALSAACMQEAEMEVYLEEKWASLKRPGSAFQRQDRKKKAPAFQQRAVVPTRVVALTPGGGTV
ncbi:hypothetical protein Taro_034201, partial [Colocasia esculenta]|nr:hypothetical protein [Colocasia esculenta]